MKTTFTQLAAAIGVSCALASSVVQAADNKFEINGAISHQDFDSKRDINNGYLGGIGLGYVLDPKWTAELWYFDGSTEIDGDKGDVDLSEYRLDALYHLSDVDGWRPYVVAGMGDMTFDVEGLGKQSETRINAGLGVKRAITENLNFRGDMRLFNSLDEEDTDFGVQLGLNYAFGESKPKVLDSDGDGVMDPADVCPNTPAGAPVDAQGCPLDSDGDGVFDYLDKCPATATVLKVDADGCPMKLVESVAIELKVYFDNDSSVVKPEYYNEIKRVSDFMAQYEGTQVEVQGFTDSRGSDAYNQKLSQRRADAVAEVLLTQHNVAADRVMTKGYGEERPVASNDSIEGRAMNRRVVAEISAQVETMKQR